MARRRNSRCRWCGRHKDECGQISHSGACAECASERLAANAEGISRGEGEAYDRWLRNTRAAVLRLK